MPARVLMGYINQLAQIIQFHSVYIYLPILVTKILIGEPIDSSISFNLSRLLGSVSIATLTAFNTTLVTAAECLADGSVIKSCSVSVIIFSENIFPAMGKIEPSMVEDMLSIILRKSSLLIHSSIELEWFDIKVYSR